MPVLAQYSSAYCSAIAAFGIYIAWGQGLTAHAERQPGGSS